MKVVKVKVSRIVSCFDGDTFRCDIDTWPKLFGYHIPVRVRGVDCPECKKINGVIPDDALLARDFTRIALVNAREIFLLNVQRGKYFRLIADVLIDGYDLRECLISRGLGKKLTY